MVTTLSNYLDARYRVDINEGYDGVVRVAIGGYYGTGTLLYDGRAILTAAHLFEGITQTTAAIYFQTAQGDTMLHATSIQIHPEYDTVDGNNDLALVWLTEDAPVSAERYTLYRQNDEISQVFDMVGYGVPGSGTTGSLSTYSGEPIKLTTTNRFDAQASDLKVALRSTMAWTPAEGTQLIADFDSGTSATDALNMFLDISDRGEGSMEGIISSGDSGGPAFIDGAIAGVASYVSSLSTYAYQPDADDVTNSSFGEIAAWQRVSAYQEWIDTSIRAMYVNAPLSASSVQKSFYEGQSGTTLTYFLVEFTGVRSADAWVSVDYATRDGSAIAGEDYLSSYGTLVLYPLENQAVIPVEIIADTTLEADETFYLDIFNPVGGSFGEGVAVLTAMRTILNDDFF